MEGEKTMPNEMRDRLIELLKDSPHLDTTYCTFESAAEWLIENGVIVPPCKVGDTLYYIPFGSHITKWGIRSIEIMQAEMVFHCGNIFFLNDDFGKTVFLTKEEAEAKLKESEQGGK